MSVDLKRMSRLCGLICVVFLAIWALSVSACADAKAAEVQPAQPDRLRQAAQQKLADYWQHVADYWRGKAQEFTATAEATESITKKDVMAMLAEDARKRSEQAQQTQNSIKNQSPGRPLVVPRVEPLPQTSLPNLPPAILEDAPVHAPEYVIGLVKDCYDKANSKYPNDFAFDTIDNVAEIMQVLTGWFACEAPELREEADRSARLVGQLRERASKEPNPDMKRSLERQADAADEIAKRLDQAAERLGEETNWGDISVAPQTVPQTQDAAGGLCPALHASPRKNESNDPYILCDCARQYLSDRVVPLYEAMIGRVKGYITPGRGAYFASVPGQIQTRALDNHLLIDISGRAATAPAQAIDDCKRQLFRAEQERATKAMDGPDPGLNVADMKALRDSVYGNLIAAFDYTWHDHFREIEFGITDLANINAVRQAVSDWKRDAEYNAVVKAGTKDYGPICAAANSAAQERVEWLGREMPRIAEPMRAVRTILAKDLRLWQDFAARDAWPDQPSLPSFGEFADRLSQSSHLRNYNGPEWGDAVRVQKWSGFSFSVCDARWDPQAPAWTARAPASLLMMTGVGEASETTPRSASPGIIKAMRDASPLLAAGPFATAKVAGAVSLVLPLFEGAEAKAVAFYSGADVTQHP
jgi:hypothetical protein